MANAAIYLRSSKDRSDVSIDSQRRELLSLATQQQHTVISEYVDVVESAKDERRPGFQQLLRDLKSQSRTWSVLLMVDTSRLSRRRYMAQVFKHEAKKRGVKIVYSKLPESDPIADMVIIGVMEVFDELHSLMSREKGLAGMAENVQQGYRAGGRAPFGYQLRKIETGAYRDGKQVTKSKLELSGDASCAKRYLEARANGISRAQAVRDSGIRSAKTTLIGIEWNALTYAGHTVWNVHNEYVDGHGYKGGNKRRPRSDWVIRHDTHPALISTEQAEAIISGLENSNHSHSRRTPGQYLLSGLLKSPAGESWHGDRKTTYRIKAGDGVKGKTVRKDDIETAIVSQIRGDMVSDVFIGRLAEEVSRRRKTTPDEAKPLRRQIVEINQQISKTMDLAVQLENPAPTVRKIDELERQRSQVAAEIDRLDKERQLEIALNSIGENEIRAALTKLSDSLIDADHDGLKERLFALVDEIVLDPASLECRIQYRIKVASPRESDLIPEFRVLTQFLVAQR